MVIGRPGFPPAGLFIAHTRVTRVLRKMIIFVEIEFRSMRKTAILSIICLLSIGCGRSNEIIVHTDNGSTRVEAVASGIMHVTSVAKGESFSKEKSLCVLPVQGNTECSKQETPDYLEITTARLTARVDKKDGRVEFYRNGERLLCEHDRSFTPFEADGVKAYTVQQTFESEEDEAFFGLGQHQADEWNYKGKNEELYQYNTKISVPFVVSSRRYGVLWDSYSFCRWGDPRPYAQLSEAFTLYDRYGQAGALTGNYTAADGTVLERRETNLEQEYLRTPQCDIVKNAPEGFDFNGSKVTFEGSLEPKTSGLHNFYIYYAGYTKVYVDDTEVVPEIWRTAWNPNGRKFALDMEAGRKYKLTVKWEPDGGVSYNALRVLSPVPDEQRSRMSWWGEMQNGIDYYLVCGDSIDGVIKGYRTLTGKSPIVPKWALGYWQSRERYTSQQEVLSTLKEFKNRQIPIDNIVQDWQYWLPDQWGSHEFDPARFPDPKGMVDSIHALGARFMISVWPNSGDGTANNREFSENGLMLPGCGVYNALKKEGRDMYWKQLCEELVHHLSGNPTGAGKTKEQKQIFQ